MKYTIVIPAKAGPHKLHFVRMRFCVWAPAFAGVTASVT